MVSGYLSYDYFIQTYWVKDTSPLGQQMFWHHVLGILGIGVGAIVGYAHTGIIAFLLLAEFSTIWINFRSFYDKKDFGKLIPQICQVVFFISFTVLRMIGLPIGVYLMFINAKFFWGSEYMTTWRYTCFTISMVCYLILWYINITWYILIVKGVKKLLGLNNKKIDAGLDEKIHNY